VGKKYPYRGYNSREIEYRLVGSIHIGVCERNKQPPACNLAQYARFHGCPIPSANRCQPPASTPAPYWIGYQLYWFHGWPIPPFFFFEKHKALVHCP
jgi:hypothetical protein